VPFAVLIRTLELMMFQQLPLVVAQVPLFVVLVVRPQMLQLVLIVDSLGF